MVRAGRTFTTLHIQKNDSGSVPSLNGHFHTARLDCCKGGDRFAKKRLLSKNEGITFWGGAHVKQNSQFQSGDTPTGRYFYPL